MKSAQFTDLFQQHVFDVFYRPETLPVEKIIDRWEQLANSLLMKVLPSEYNQAVTKIKDQLFISSELEYHFEDLRITYDIVVTDNRVNIENNMTANLVLSPRHPNPTFKQTFEVGGSCCLASLYINDKQQNVEQLLRKCPQNQNAYKLELELNEFDKTAKQAHRKPVKFERTLTLTQNLDEEPYIVAAISRYVTGAVVKAKISPGYRMYFKKTGLGVLPDKFCSDDEQGYTRWQLAEDGDLLLPGQGFIIMFIPRQNAQEVTES